MNQKILHILSWLFFALMAIAFFYSCANIAAPTGGLYDVEPPKMRRATPEMNALHVDRTRIEIEFDENIKIEKPSEKVIITPPQTEMPVIKSVGKKAIVELYDELLPNTTYTIDFTDAIADNNEGNPLENFVYSFSTGDKLDTLGFGGVVLNAENLEPITGIYVGVHTNMDDTAFTNVRFERISRTDSRGKFTVRGLADGTYKVYALNDQNRDFRYDNPQEEIAFFDETIQPSTEPAVRYDTLYNAKDTTKIDSIYTIHYTRYIPDDVVLRSFASAFKRQYLQNSERKERHKINLFFGAPTSLPTLSMLKPERSGNDWYITERNKTNDTISLWITDSLIYQQDSLWLKVDYTKTDSLNQNFLASDTLRLNFRPVRQPKEEQKKEDDEEETAPQTPKLAIKSNIQSSFDVFQSIDIEFDAPVLRFDSTTVALKIEKDSVYTPIPFTLIADSLNPRKYTIKNRWEPTGKYQLTIDSSAVSSIYGLSNELYEQKFTIKSLEEYGNLEISISGLPQMDSTWSAYAVLLDKSDKPLRQVKVRNNAAKFQDLQPGSYYTRLFVDENGDGEWTTGEYTLKRQPEMVYYNPQMYEIKAFADHFESWNVTALPLDKQKPLEITKNKPAEKKRRNPNEELEEQKRQNQQRSSPFSNMGSGSSSPSGPRQVTR